MTRVMAVELGPHQIRVNSVNPTVFYTTGVPEVRSDQEMAILNRHPLGRFAEVEDVVHPILYLLSDKAAMITGTCLAVDGGYLAT